MIQCFCAAQNLDGMESMIHLFWVSTILSYERKEKSWWVMNLLHRISILLIVFTNINLAYRHEGGSESACTHSLCSFYWWALLVTSILAPLPWELLQDSFLMYEHYGISFGIVPSLKDSGPCYISGFKCVSSFYSSCVLPLQIWYLVARP